MRGNHTAHVDTKSSNSGTVCTRRNSTFTVSTATHQHFSLPQTPGPYTYTCTHGHTHTRTHTHRVYAVRVSLPGLEHALDVRGTRSVSEGFPGHGRQPSRGPAPPARDTPAPQSSNARSQHHVSLAYPAHTATDASAYQWTRCCTQSMRTSNTLHTRSDDDLVLLGNMPHIDPLQWTMQYLASSSGAPYSH